MGITKAFAELSLNELRFGQYWETPPASLPFISFKDHDGEIAVGYLAFTESFVAKLQQENLPIVFASENFSPQLLKDCEDQKYVGIVVARSFDAQLEPFVRNSFEPKTLSDYDFLSELAHFRIKAAQEKITVLYGDAEQAAFRIERSGTSGELVYTWRTEEHRLKEGEIVSIEGEFKRLYPGELPRASTSTIDTLSNYAEGLLLFSEIVIEANGDSLSNGDSFEAAKYGAKRMGLIRTERGTRKALFKELAQTGTAQSSSNEKYWEDLIRDQQPLSPSIFQKTSKLEELSPKQKLSRQLFEQAAGILFPRASQPFKLYVEFIEEEKRLIKILDSLAEKEIDLRPELEEPVSVEDVAFLQCLFNAHSIEHPLTDLETESSYKNLVEISRGELTLRDLLLSHQMLVLEKKKFPISVRLVDLKGIGDYLPSEIKEQLLGQIATTNDVTFEQLRLGLYEAQIAAIIHCHTVFSRAEFALTEFAPPPEILVPFVQSTEELIEIKNLVESIIENFDYFDEEGQPYYQFGAMLETASSLDCATEIASVCDFVKFGTNDLTQELTGLNRSIFDHSTWMKQKGYDLSGRYQSPFQTLIPPVREKMKIALEAMRIVNPDLRIGICGHQMTDYHSLLAALNMGIKYISVPPTYSDINRAKITAAKFLANTINKEVE